MAHLGLAYQLSPSKDAFTLFLIRHLCGPSGTKTPAMHMRQSSYFGKGVVCGGVPPVARVIAGSKWVWVWVWVCEGAGAVVCRA